MKLISLLEKLEYTCLQGSTDQEVKNVVYDSRKVEEGDVYKRQEWILSRSSSLLIAIMSV